MGGGDRQQEPAFSRQYEGSNESPTPVRADCVSSAHAAKKWHIYISIALSLSIYIYIYIHMYIKMQWDLCDAARGSTRDRSWRVGS